MIKNKGRNSVGNMKACVVLATKRKSKKNMEYEEVYGAIMENIRKKQSRKLENTCRVRNERKKLKKIMEYEEVFGVVKKNKRKIQRKQKKKEKV